MSAPEINVDDPATIETLLKVWRVSFISGSVSAIAGLAQRQGGHPGFVSAVAHHAHHQATHHAANILEDPITRHAVLDAITAAVRASPDAHVLLEGGLPVQAPERDS